MKLQMITKVLCLAALTSWLPITPSLAQSGPGQFGKVRYHSSLYSCTNDGDSVNLRSNAGQQHKVVRSVPSGKELILLGNSKVAGNKGWQKVSFYGVVGWVRGDFLCK